MSNPKTQRIPIKLDYPVQLADRLLAEVTIRRPNIGDLLDYPVNDKTGLREEVALIAHVCDLNTEDVRALDVEDYDKLQAQMLRFRGVSVD
jgi:hypothetical protein